MCVCVCVGVGHVLIFFFFCFSFFFFFSGIGDVQCGQHSIASVHGYTRYQPLFPAVVTGRRGSVYARVCVV